MTIQQKHLIKALLNRIQKKLDFLEREKTDILEECIFSKKNLIKLNGLYFKMTNEEIDKFLHEEELVPVAFLQNLSGLGFIVDQTKSEADIPQGFTAQIQFWLAIFLAGQDDDLIAIDEPSWLKNFGPGSVVTDDISYQFSHTIGQQTGNPNTSAQLIELCKSRIDTIVNSCFKVRNRQLDRQDPVFLSEEREIVDASRENYQQFLQWKTGSMQI